MLLGGKLVASLVRTRDIYNDFKRAYGNTTGLISEEAKGARLLAVTTSSSLGRSSIYNRLRLDKIDYFKIDRLYERLGHFHVPNKLFEDLRAFLRSRQHSYADHHKYGEGPNWRLRTTRVALSLLGLKEVMLRHGIQREVFLCQLATNALGILRKGKGRPNLSSLLTAKEVAALAVDRWMLPRAERRSEFRKWRREGVLQLLTSSIAAEDETGRRVRAA